MIEPIVAHGTAANSVPGPRIQKCAKRDLWERALEVRDDGALGKLAASKVVEEFGDLDRRQSSFCRAGGRPEPSRLRPCSTVSG